MITSNANQHVKQVIAWQTKAKERAKSGIFIVEGPRMFVEAPDAWIQEVYVAETFENKVKTRAHSEEKNDTYTDVDMNEKVLNKLETFPYEVVKDDLFAKMSDTQTPQGVLTVLKRPAYTVEGLLKGSAQPLLMILEDLQDPGNLGTIIRTSEGAGVTGVILSKGSVDLFNPKVVRATMGSIYRVPFVYVEDLQEVLGLLKQAGITTYAAHLKGSKTYDQFDYQAPTAFMIGNEGNGLKKETADAADSYLLIPMEGQLESLNASVAAALLMYEAHRQRGIL